MSKFARSSVDNAETRELLRGDAIWLGKKPKKKVLRPDVGMT